MSKHGRDKRPNVRPITKIELSEKHKKLRLILIVVLLSIGSVAIGMGLFSLLNTQPGWQEIDVASDKPNCSTEFRLLYDFSDAGGDATAVNKVGYVLTVFVIGIITRTAGLVNAGVKSVKGKSKEVTLIVFRNVLYVGFLIV